MSRIRELISFTRHLYYFTKMGATLPESLSNLGKDISDRELKDAIKTLKSRVEGGKTLSEAMEGHPEIFPDDYRKMLESAEETENLPQVLSELAGYLETVEVTGRNLRFAAFYPGLILNFCFIFVFIIYYFAFDILFNQYVDFIQGTGHSLSSLTWFFINAGRFIFNPAFMIIIFIILISLDILLFARSSLGTRVFLKLPVVKDIFQKSYMARISRSLGFMLNQGIAMDKALELVAGTVESGKIKRLLLNASENLLRGRTLSEVFEETGLFDNTFIFMIKQGEKTEKLPGALFYIAEYFEDEIKSSHSVILRFAEPVFIITVGIIVGFLLVSIFAPFYSITGVIN